MNKSIKKFFWGKKKRPKSVVLHPWKKLQVLGKKIFRKKNPSSLFVQIRPTKRYAEIYLKWISFKILNFRWFFGSEKLFFTTKLLIKLDRQKIKKISHTVLEKIILQIIPKNFCKIGLNPEEMGLLECALAITFFNENC